MAIYTTSPLMQLKMVGLGQKQWFSLWQQNFILLDAHDHTAGKGTKIPVAGLNINDNLDISSYPLTSAAYLAFTEQAANPSVNDAAWFSSADGEFWIKDGLGNAVQMTASGFVNVSGAGSITGTVPSDSFAMSGPTSNRLLTILNSTSPSYINLRAGNITLTDLLPTGDITVLSGQHVDVGDLRVETTGITNQLGNPIAIGTTLSLSDSGSNSILSSSGSIIANNCTLVGGNITLPGYIKVTADSVIGSTSLTPASALHIDKGTATASDLRFTAGATTGQSATDGLSIGIDATGACIINQYEALGIDVLTSNTSRLSISAAGLVDVKAGFHFTGGVARTDEIDDGNSGATPTIDWTLGNNQKITLNAIATFTLTSPGSPSHLTLKMTQDGVGGKTVTWPASVKWSNGAQPPWITTAGALNIVFFYFDGTNYYGSGMVGVA